MKSSKSQNLNQITDGIDQLIKFTQRLAYSKKKTSFSTESVLLVTENSNYSKSLTDLNKATTTTTTTTTTTMTTQQKPEIFDSSERVAKNEKSTILANGQVKLISPLGDYCGFSGGGGSGGCVVTGPYEACFFLQNDKSDSSFDSTEITVDSIDLDEPPDFECDHFQKNEIIWVKRSGLPWFPGIVVDLINFDKETKDLIKSCGAHLQSKKELEDMKQALRKDDDFYCVVLFNKKRSWIRVSKKKMKKFTKNNEHYFMQSMPLLGTKLRKDLEKAYKRAKKHIDEEFT